MKMLILATIALVSATATACDTSDKNELLALECSVEKAASFVISATFSERTNTTVTLLCFLAEGTELERQLNGKYSAEVKCVHPRMNVFLQLTDAYIQPDGNVDFEVGDMRVESP